MDRIVIWGTGTTYTVYRDALLRMEKNGEMTVSALVSKESVSEKDGWPLVSKEELHNCQYDMIVIAASGDQNLSIRADIDGLHMPSVPVINVMDFVTDVFEEETTEQIRVLRDILSATDEEVRDPEWISGIVNRYGIFYFSERQSPGAETNWTPCGVQQIRKEFAGFCCFLSGLKIEKAIEIGVFMGRSSYIMCALLYRNNPGLRYLLVDIEDRLDHYEQFREVLPCLEKHIPARSDDFKGQVFDFVFIDADHSYDASMRDYQNVGQYATKAVVFHDIYGHEYDVLNGGVPRTWREVKELTSDCEHREFSEYPDEWMGIGVVCK